MGTKDFFSGHSKIYAAFRPTYPAALYEFLLNCVRQRSAAWDCATGTGQVARHLAPHFDRVYATDISPSQIAEAPEADNIFYSVSPAESTPFPSNHFDLITVAQALHWIGTEDFYREVARTGKSNAILAVWGYGLPAIGPKVDLAMKDFYRNTVGPYWDEARKHVDEGYANMPFPFDRIPSPGFDIQLRWTIDQFAGYLTSWSATQKYIQAQESDPVITFIDSVRRHWPVNEKKTVVFPIFTSIGRIA